jgi:hypothetical protein
MSLRDNTSRLLSPGATSEEESAKFPAQAGAGAHPAYRTGKGTCRVQVQVIPQGPQYFLGSQTLGRDFHCPPASLAACSCMVGKSKRRG